MSGRASVFTLGRLTVAGMGLVLVLCSGARGAVVTITVEPGGSATVTGNGTYNLGDECTLTATPSPGFRFAQWYDHISDTYNEPLSGETTHTFTVTRPVHQIIAYLANAYFVSATASPTEGGTVTGTDTYDPMSSCTVTATPNAGYRFMNWTDAAGAVSSNASYTFNVTADRYLTANFAREYTITVAATPAGTGVVTGAGTYLGGGTCAVHATPNVGYDFVDWQLAGVPVSTNSNYSFTVVADAGLVATFEVSSYDITTSSNPVAGGTTAGGGTFDHGTSVTVTATSAAGYGLLNWTSGGSAVSTNASYTFTAVRDAALVANFALKHTVTSSAGSNGTIAPAGAVIVLEGQDQAYTITPAVDYAVESVEVDGSAVALCLSYTFTDVDADHTIDVLFGVDTDDDDLADSLEGFWGTTIGSVDTDADGYSDGWEVLNGYDPADPLDPPPPSEHDSSSSCGAPLASGGTAAWAIMLACALLARRAKVAH